MRPRLESKSPFGIAERNLSHPLQHIGQYGTDILEPSSLDALWMLVQNSMSLVYADGTTQKQDDAENIPNI